MTREQRRIIAILAVADLAVIVGVVVLMTHLARTTVLPLPTPTFSDGLPGLVSAACQWQAAQEMAQAGLSGSVTLSPDTLNFEITTLLAPGQTTDDAAQLIWTAFDVALALGEECPFSRVKVTIHIRDSDTTLHATVAAADLAAYDAGTLTEDEFITRVTYTIR